MQSFISIAGVRGRGTTQTQRKQERLVPSLFEVGLGVGFGWDWDWDGVKELSSH